VVGATQTVISPATKRNGAVPRANGWCGLSRGEAMPFRRSASARFSRTARQAGPPPCVLLTCWAKASSPENMSMTAFLMSPFYHS